MLGHIAFLSDKGIYDQAERMVNKAKRYALRYEQLSVLPTILQWQKHIIEAQSYWSKTEVDLRHLYGEYQDLLDQLNNQNEYWWLQAQLYYLHTHKGLLHNTGDFAAIEQLLQHPLLQNEEQARTYDAKQMVYRIFSTYYYLSRQFPQAYAYTQKMVDLLESRPELLDLDPLAYINAINNLLNMTAVLNKTDERVFYLSKLENGLQNAQWNETQAVRLRLLEAYYYHLMTWHIHCNTYNEGLPRVREMETQLFDASTDDIDTTGSVMLCFYAFHICFGANDFTHAHTWLQRIVQHPREEVRQDAVRLLANPAVGRGLRIATTRLVAHHFAFGVSVFSQKRADL